LTLKEVGTTGGRIRCFCLKISWVQIPTLACFIISKKFCLSYYAAETLHARKRRKVNLSKLFTDASLSSNPQHLLPAKICFKLSSFPKHPQGKLQFTLLFTKQAQKDVGKVAPGKGFEPPFTSKNTSSTLFLA
jgi:hypothetical protein